MAREIAVFRGTDGLTAALGEPGKLTVFRRWQAEWEAVRETDCLVDAKQGLRELRRNMESVVEFLGECRIFVARVVTGVPYFELEKAGFSIWEYPGEPVDYLEHIWAQEEKDAYERLQEKPAAVFGPVEKENGYFFISLKDIQAKNAGITSKQALLPFIRKGRFRVLEVTCRHIPPWLEQELLSGRVTIKTEQVGTNEIILTIMNNFFVN